MPTFRHSSGRRRRLSTLGSSDERFDDLYDTTPQLQVDGDIYSPASPLEPLQIGHDARRQLRAELFGRAQESEPHRSSQPIPPSLAPIAASIVGYQGVRAAAPTATAPISIDIEAAITILQELKKTATTEDLVALHRALLPDKAQIQELPSTVNTLSRSTRSYHGDLHRRRSAFKPGEATRSNDTPIKQDLVAQEVSHGQRGMIKPATFAVPSEFLRPGSLQPAISRAGTPSDFEQPCLGRLKLGSLRITNGGAASPQSARVGNVRSVSDSTMGREDDYFTASEGSGRDSPAKAQEEPICFAITDDYDDGGKTPTQTSPECLGSMSWNRAGDANEQSLLGMHKELDDEGQHGSEMTEDNFNIRWNGLSLITLPGAVETHTSTSSESPSFSSDGLTDSVQGYSVYSTGITTPQDLCSPRKSWLSDQQRFDPLKSNPISATGSPRTKIRPTMPQRWSAISSISRTSGNSLVDKHSQLRDSGYGSEALLRNYQGSSHTRSSAMASTVRLNQSNLSGDKNSSAALILDDPVEAPMQETEPTLPRISPSSRSTGVMSKLLPQQPSTPERPTRKQGADDRAQGNNTPTSSPMPSLNATSNPHQTSTPRKLQKRRPVSERTPTTPIIVQGQRQITGAPNIPFDILTKHAERIVKHPGMDHLERTYKSVAHSGSRESLVSIEHEPFQIEYRFPSPDPDSDHHSRGRKSQRRSYGCHPSPTQIFRSRSRKSLSRPRSDLNTPGQSETFTMNATDLDGLAASMGPSTYQLAATATAITRSRTSSASRSPTPSATRSRTPSATRSRTPSTTRSRNPSADGPRVLTRPPPRPKSVVGMTARAAAELAMARSRDRLANIDGSGRKRSSLPQQHQAKEPVDISRPSDPMPRPRSYATGLPPVPALPDAKQVVRPDIVRQPTIATVGSSGAGDSDGGWSDHARSWRRRRQSIGEGLHHAQPTAHGIITPTLTPGAHDDDDSTVFDAPLYPGHQTSIATASATLRLSPASPINTQTPDTKPSAALTLSTTPQLYPAPLSWKPARSTPPRRAPPPPPPAAARTDEPAPPSVSPEISPFVSPLSSPLASSSPAASPLASSPPSRLPPPPPSLTSTITSPTRDSPRRGTPLRLITQPPIQSPYVGSKTEDAYNHQYTNRDSGCCSDVVTPNWEEERGVDGVSPLLQEGKWEGGRFGGGKGAVAGVEDEGTRGVESTTMWRWEQGGMEEEKEGEDEEEGRREVMRMREIARMLRVAS